MKQFNIGDSPMAHLTPDELSGPSHTLLKKSLVVAVLASSIILVPTAQAAQAFEAKLSGQVSRMVVAPDDAAGDELQYVDIGWSGSRFRFTGSDTADNGLTWGFRFEIQARENSAGAPNGANLGDTGDNQDNRYQDLYLSGDFGKISFGKGDGAANGSTEVDFSGTALASAAPLTDNWGSYEVAPGVAWKNYFTIADALSRQNRVRYDTPNFNGFSAAVGLNQGNASELALRYKGDVGGGKLGFAIFTATAADVDATTDGADITGGSISYLHDSGFNVTAAISDIDADGPVVAGDKEATFFKVGYKTGKHAVSIDMGDGEDGFGVEGDSTGLTYAFFPMKGVELFATSRELDADCVGCEAADIIAIGSRIKF